MTSLKLTEPRFTSNATASNFSYIERTLDDHCQRYPPSAYSDSFSHSKPFLIRELYPRVDRTPPTISRAIRSLVNEKFIQCLNPASPLSTRFYRVIEENSSPVEIPDLLEAFHRLDGSTHQIDLLLGHQSYPRRDYLYFYTTGSSRRINLPSDQVAKFFPNQVQLPNRNLTLVLHHKPISRLPAASSSGCKPLNEVISLIEAPRICQTVTGLPPAPDARLKELLSTPSVVISFQNPYVWNRLAHWQRKYLREQIAIHQPTSSPASP